MSFRVDGLEKTLYGYTYVSPLEMDWCVEAYAPNSVIQCCKPFHPDGDRVLFARVYAVLLFYDPVIELLCILISFKLESDVQFMSDSQAYITHNNLSRC